METTNPMVVRCYLLLPVGFIVGYTNMFEIETQNHRTICDQNAPNLFIDL